MNPASCAQNSTKVLIERATPFTPLPCPLAEKPQPGARRPQPHWGGEAAIPWAPQRLPGFLPGKAQDVAVPSLQEEGPENDHQGPASLPAPDQCSYPRMELQSPSQANYT